VEKTLADFHQHYFNRVIKQLEKNAETPRWIDGRDCKKRENCNVLETGRLYNQIQKVFRPQKWKSHRKERHTDDLWS
jgi:hypothetical protein